MAGLASVVNARGACSTVDGIAIDAINGANNSYPEAV